MHGEQNTARSNDGNHGALKFFEIELCFLILEIRSVSVSGVILFDKNAYFPTASSCGTVALMSCLNLEIAPIWPKI